VIAVALVLLVVAAGGLLLRRQLAAGARWTAWGVALVFAATCLLLPESTWRAAAAAPTVLQLAGTTVEQRTQALVASAAAGPRAGDVRLHWQRGVVPAGERGLGALVAMPEPLALQPDAIQVRCLGFASQGRPVLLEFVSPPLAAPVAGELRVSAAGDVVARASLGAGDGTHTFEFVPTTAGEHRLEWVASVAGHELHAVGTLTIAPAAPVLIVGGDAALAAALQVQGVDIVTAETLPESLARFAAIVVSRPLAASEQRILVDLVRDGCGAFVLGPAFPAPGEPLAELLPVRPLPRTTGTGQATAGGTGIGAGDPASMAPDGPPRGDVGARTTPSTEPIEVDKRAIAMVLVVDRSGSMGERVAGGATKMSYAKTSALRTAQALGEGDAVAVVTFGNKNQPVTVLPMTDAADLATVRAGIERLAHGAEQTFLLGGLRRAHELLQPGAAAVKHVVVITDGEFRVEEEVALGAEAHQMRSNGVTLSMISIVDKNTDSQFLVVAERVTREGGGQFFQVTDATAVPALVSAEVTRSLTRAGRAPKSGDGGGPGADGPRGAPDPSPAPAPPLPTPERPRLVVRAVAQSALLAPEPATWPTLGDAVPATAPLDAQVLLIAGDDGWPLLAFANRGLGRVGAFAADLAGEAGAEFRRESAFPARLASWVQHLLPSRPTSAPVPLLAEYVVTPPAPTPRDAEALAVLAGAPPVSPNAWPAPEPVWAREPSTAADFAPWLIALLVLLAVVERLVGVRLWRA